MAKIVNTIRKAPSLYTKPKSIFTPKMRAVAKEMLSTKEGSLKLLQGAGILDKDGKETKHYRDASYR